MSMMSSKCPSNQLLFSCHPFRDHDDCHLPHPVEMGPQESWNSHFDCGEAAGAAGHAGISTDTQSLLFNPVEMVAQGFLRSCACLVFV